MKTLERVKAITLRKEGKTYIEIQKSISVSKSCLSYWLRDIDLNNSQLKRIYQKNLKIRRKFIEYNHLKRRRAIMARNHISQLAKREIKNLSKRELKLIGSALYWGEGAKVSARGGSEGLESQIKIVEEGMAKKQEKVQVDLTKIQIVK